MYTSSRSTRWCSLMANTTRSGPAGAPVGILGAYTSAGGRTIIRRIGPAVSGEQRVLWAITISARMCIASLRGAGRTGADPGSVLSVGVLLADPRQHVRGARRRQRNCPLTARQCRPDDLLRVPRGGQRNRAADSGCRLPITAARSPRHQPRDRPAGGDRPASRGRGGDGTVRLCVPARSRQRRSRPGIPRDRRGADSAGSRRANGKDDDRRWR